MPATGKSGAFLKARLASRRLSTSTSQQPLSSPFSISQNSFQSMCRDMAPASMQFRRNSLRAGRARVQSIPRRHCLARGTECRGLKMTRTILRLSEMNPAIGQIASLPTKTMIQTAPTPAPPRPSPDPQRRPHLGRNGPSRSFLTGLRAPACPKSDCRPSIPARLKQ